MANIVSAWQTYGITVHSLKGRPSITLVFSFDNSISDCTGIIMHVKLVKMLFCMLLLIRPHRIKCLFELTRPTTKFKASNKDGLLRSHLAHSVPNPTQHAWFVGKALSNFSTAFIGQEKKFEHSSQIAELLNIRIPAHTPKVNTFMWPGEHTCCGFWL